MGPVGEDDLTARQLMDLADGWRKRAQDAERERDVLRTIIEETRAGLAMLAGNLNGAIPEYEP